MTIPFSQSSRAALLVLSSALALQAQESNGLAPEVADLNAAAVSYALEAKLPDLPQAFLSTKPQQLDDGLAVGELGRDSGDRNTVLAFAREIEAGTFGEIDSLLIAHRGKLLFESYYRRGRLNYPHYQMSITKSYTAMAMGRAIQLGYLTMADLDRPVVSFLKDLDASRLAAGAREITLAEAMNMRSGVRVDEAKVMDIRANPAALKGQGQIQAYLENSNPIPAPPREFKYQAADTCMTMQVLEAVVPGSARDFIANELFGRMGITNYHWETDISGLPKSAAGSGVRSRDMVKWGLLIMHGGHWQGEQLIPAAFVAKATSRMFTNRQEQSYGYFWWSHTVKLEGREFDCVSGRGAGGQYIFILPQVELIAVVTAHHQGMGSMLTNAPRRLIPAFLPK